MGILEGMILIIMCIFRMIIINLPAFLMLVSIQAIVYWISGISIYNTFINFCLKEI